MTLRPRFFSTLGTQLATAVTNTSTFTVAYPAGTTRFDFDKGLADLNGCYVQINDNDRIPFATSGVRIGISFGASNITITNNSGYTLDAGTIVDLHLAVKSGNRQLITVPVPPLAGLTNADIITEMYLGVEADLEFAEFVTTVAVTTAARAATLNWEIGTTDVTGMTLALTSATVTPKGIVLPFGLPTANFTLRRSSVLSLEASSVTAFAEGEGYINLYLRTAQTALDDY